MRLIFLITVNGLYETQIVVGKKKNTVSKTHIQKSLNILRALLNCLLIFKKRIRKSYSIIEPPIIQVILLILELILIPVLVRTGISCAGTSASTWDGAAPHVLIMIICFGFDLSD